jgi:hypothetical protein
LPKPDGFLLGNAHPCKLIAAASNADNAVSSTEAVENSVETLTSKLAKSQEVFEFL